MIEPDDLEEDALEGLSDLFDDLSLDGPNPDQLYKMYGIFLNDIVKNPIVIKGKTLKYNANKSKHPICKGKAQTFEHVITRESKIAGKRNFDPERANKIHWIKPILLNGDDVRIRYFERVNHKGQNQYYYWFEEKRFIIILREIKADMILITSFCVDNYERGKLRRWYNEYRK